MCLASCNLEDQGSQISKEKQQDCDVEQEHGNLEHVQSNRPDLVLLDIMMPKMSGYEVCRQLKSDPATQDILILMITALHEISDIERGVEAGTDDFLSKPINKLELLTRVKSLLRVCHLTDERDRLLAYLEDLDTARWKQSENQP